MEKSKKQYLGEIYYLCYDYDIICLFLEQEACVFVYRTIYDCAITDDVQMALRVLYDCVVTGVTGIGDCY